LHIVPEQKCLEHSLFQAKLRLLRQALRPTQDLPLLPRPSRRR
jgi:hypothetical protein